MNRIPLQPNDKNPLTRHMSVLSQDYPTVSNCLVFNLPLGRIRVGNKNFQAQHLYPGRGKRLFPHNPGRGPLFFFRERKLS